jgi:polyadenylation factor subunit 2
MLPPVACAHLPASSYNTKVCHVCVNRNRGSINTVSWTAEGRRCLTGAQSGEFTLWNGSTFGFEAIYQVRRDSLSSACNATRCAPS